MDTYTLGRNSLDKGSAPCSSLYLFDGKHSQKKKISMPPPGFKPKFQQVSGHRLMP